MKKENELNEFGFRFINGICIGFKFEKYSNGVSTFEILLPFCELSWSKRMVSDNEAEEILNK